jgi:enoyl-CoA hydratase/carnithine racemase
MSESVDEPAAAEPTKKSYQTFIYEVADHVATITLNRPERLNSFNQQVLEEFSAVWYEIRYDDDVHAVVLRANGDRAWSTGADVVDGIYLPDNIWSHKDPGKHLGAKQNQVWKPIVCALHGMVAGGGLYWVNESDIVICADTTMFFDPHVSYGMVAALEPIGLARRIPIGDALRMALLGLDERMSAARALQIGLVTEVVSRDQLWERAAAIAKIIAAKPPSAVQGTVRAIWETLGIPPTAAQDLGMVYTRMGALLEDQEANRVAFTKPKWTLR